MSERRLRGNSSSSLIKFPRGKSHRKTEAKTTVGVCLSKNLVEKASLMRSAMQEQSKK